MLQILKSWCSYVKAVFRIIPLAFYCSNLWEKKPVYPESSLRPWFTLTKIRESGVLLGLVAGLRIKPPKLRQLHYLPAPEYYPPLPGQSRPSHPYSIEAKSSESAESKAHKNQKHSCITNKSCFTTVQVRARAALDNNDHKLRQGVHSPSVKGTAVELASRQFQLNKSACFSPIKIQQRCALLLGVWLIQEASQGIKSIRDLSSCIRIHMKCFPWAVAPTTKSGVDSSWRLSDQKHADNQLMPKHQPFYFHDTKRTALLWHSKACNVHNTPGLFVQAEHL